MSVLVYNKATPTLSAIADILEPRDHLPIHLDLFQEHFLRTHPKSMVAILLSVHDEFFQRFGVPGDAQDGVFVAFVVTVASRLHGGHKGKLGLMNSAPAPCRDSSSRLRFQDKFLRIALTFYCYPTVTARRLCHVSIARPHLKKRALGGHNGWCSQDSPEPGLRLQPRP